MGDTSDSARVLVRAVALLCALCAVVLVLVAVLVDLDTGDRMASVAGAVAGLVGLALSVRALRPADTAAVRARGRGAAAIGGNVSGSAVGRNSKVTGQPAAPGPGGTRQGGGPVTAEGDGAVAAGGDVTGSALGEGSEVDGP
ncbi:hypothetical protein GO001_22585 [Streptomyces sp. NRRL B-1677]|uniref:hypothetical protein n=1 Tax=Streptomyces TaxID=1883 RepID=UPI00189299E4|nr:hypothetical protein [Streptomyces sp. NRRL B-1677]MBF6047973.1 hypothetical protein [Streptomyces sp. NRRL B-1677]